MPLPGTVVTFLLIAMCSLSAISARLASVPAQSSTRPGVTGSTRWSLCPSLFSTAPSTGSLESDDSPLYPAGWRRIAKESSSPASPTASSGLLLEKYLHTASQAVEGEMGKGPAAGFSRSETEETVMSLPTPTAASTPTARRPTAASRWRTLSYDSTEDGSVTSSKQAPQTPRPTVAPSKSKPTTTIPASCRVAHTHFIGDGWCDQGLGYNTEACGYDGGDCCVETCESSTYPCGIAGFNCRSGQSSSAEIMPLSLFLVASNISQEEGSGQRGKETQEDVGTRLQTLLTASLSSFLSLNADIRNISLNTSPDHPQKMSSLRSSSSFRTMDAVSTSASNWTVFLNLSAASLDSAPLEFLANCASSGDLEKAARLLATRLQWSDFTEISLCSPQNSTNCTAAMSTPVDSTASMNSGNYDCRQSGGWTTWYDRPAQLPASLAVHVTMLVAWTALLPLPVLSLQRQKANVYQALAALGQTMSVALRLGYHLFIVVEALQPGQLDDVACIELSYLDSDGDPSYTLLQSLFYLALLSSVAWDLAGKAEGLRHWRPTWTVILLVVMGLLIWQCTVAAVALWDDVSNWSGLQTAREVSQFIVGSILIVLAGVYFTIRGKPSAPAMSNSLVVVMALVGTFTILTAIQWIMDSPAAAFWLYSFYARILEALCIVILCMGTSSASNGRSESPPVSTTARDPHTARHEILVEEKKEEGEENDRRAMLLRPPRPRSPLSASPTSYVSVPNHREDISDLDSHASERTSSILFSDRIHTGPELPGWIRRWTEPNRRGRAKSLFASSSAAQPPPAREARGVTEYSPVAQHLPPLRIPGRDEMEGGVERERAGTGEVEESVGPSLRSEPAPAERPGQPSRASRLASTRKRLRG